MSNPTIAVFTPTGDRPKSFDKLFSTYLPRQTMQPDYWFVQDDGKEPRWDVDFRHGILNYSRLVAGKNKAEAFCSQVLHFCNVIEKWGTDIDYVVIMEDDDWYSPHYIENRINRLVTNQGMIAGSKNALYYNIEHRQWRTCGNSKRASFAETAFSAKLIPKLKKIAQKCYAEQSSFIDAELWKHCVTNKHVYLLDDTRLVVGMKGLPGRKGIGIGHRPFANKKGDWQRDPNLDKLKELIGEGDTWFYRNLKYVAENG